MYAYITGLIENVGENSLIIDNNGIGYLLNVSTNCISKMSGKSGPVRLYTYQVVREDEISLCGFYSQEEKAMFLKLIDVSGIGPKLALSVLSGIDASGLAKVIVAGDVKTLSTVKGVGKKTAERIVLELRGGMEGLDAGIPAAETMPDSVNDAVLALVNLGITRQEAYNAVIKASAKGGETPDIVAEALRSLYRR